MNFIPSEKNIILTKLSYFCVAYFSKTIRARNLKQWHELCDQVEANKIIRQAVVRIALQFSSIGF